MTTLDVDDAKKVNHFERGLRNDIRKKVKARRFQHYLDVVECAGVWEHDYHHQQVKKGKSKLPRRKRIKT